MRLVSTLSFFSFILSSSASPLSRRDEGSGMTQADESKILELHNKFRQRFGVGDLAWDPSLVPSARQYAGKCRWTEHSPEARSGSFGENISMNNMAGPQALDGLVGGWSDEESKYDYNKPGFSTATGHFTQMVWKATTKIGCGLQYCNYPGEGNPTGFSTGDWKSGSGVWVLVCHYLSPGNIGNPGFFEANVPKPGSAPSPSSPPNTGNPGGSQGNPSPQGNPAPQGNPNPQVNLNPQGTTIIQGNLSPQSNSIPVVSNSHPNGMGPLFAGLLPESLSALLHLGQ